MILKTFKSLSLSSIDIYVLLFPIHSPIQPKEEAKITFKLKPPTEGRQTIVAKFTSNELDDVDGFLNFMVSPVKDKSNGTTA